MGNTRRTIYRAEEKRRAGRVSNRVFQKDDGYLEKFIVKCLNHGEGCQNLVTYYAEPETRELKKLCLFCAEFGSPGENMTGVVSKGGACGGETSFLNGNIYDIVQITARPRGKR